MMKDEEQQYARLDGSVRGLKQNSGLYLKTSRIHELYTKDVSSDQSDTNGTNAPQPQLK